MKAPFVAGVTGTNGKTTVVEFARQLLCAAGLRTASFGSRGVVDGDGTVTAGSVGRGRDALPRLCERLGADGHEAVVLEAFSVALARRLHDDLDVAAAAFTNLGQDHLDYHRSPDRYLRAKCRLFETVLCPGGTAVLLPDAPGAAQVIQACRRARRSIVTCGPGRDLSATRLEPIGGRLVIEIGGFGRTAALTVATDHELLVDDVLLAAGLAVVAGVDLAGLSGAHLEPPPARMERLGVHRGAEVFLDTGHNPAALEAALGALRGPTGRLIVVLGCGGNRDPGKRTPMGEVAARLADEVVVTDDNPRGEDPEAIRAAVLQGCPEATEIADRVTAIRHALDRAGPGDRVLVTGKGDEQRQLVSGRALPHSDRRAAMEVIGVTT